MFGNFFRKLTGRYGSDKQYAEVIKDLFGFYPANIELYKLALIHRSASSLVKEKGENNERLEFLGDAVLEIVISDFLYRSFPDMKEGSLTQLRSKFVNRTTLNELALKIGLSDHIISQSGNLLMHKHIYGDALEALIGAMYLDKGFVFTRSVVLEMIISPHIDIERLTETESDHKSRLIEWCQKSKHSITFNTVMTEESTPQRPYFRSIAVIDDMEIGYGLGSTKKEAEQAAARSVSQLLIDKKGDQLLERLDSKVDA